MRPDTISFRKILSLLSADRDSIALMPHRSAAILIGFGVAAGLPAYYLMIKRRAAASLRKLLAERFSPRPCPITEVRTPHGPVIFREAYDDKFGTGLVLLLGAWQRSRTAYNLVSGLFRPGGRLDVTDPVAGRGPQVLTAQTLEPGGLVVWKELPTRESVLAQFGSVK